MATSGYLETRAAALPDIRVRLEWERTSVVRNSSVIKFKLFIYNDSWDNLLSANSVRYEINIDGLSFSGTTNANLVAWATKEVFNKTITIEHNEDGTREFAFSFKQGLGTSKQMSGTFVIGSGTAILDAIPKVATLITAPSFTDEENPTITYENPAWTTLDELQACIANSKGNYIYVPYRDISKTGNSYTFNLTIDERNALRAAATSSMLSLRFYIKSTYAGSTSYSFLDRMMTLEEIEPEITPTVKDVDEQIVALTGDDSKIIIGFSDINYDIGATAPEGTSLITQSIRCGTQTQSTDKGTFTNVTTNVVEFSATDSRGNTKLVTVEMDTIPYINVTCNQSVILNMNGTIDLTVQGNYFSESFGAQNNTLKIEARSREQGGEWTNWGDISVLLAEATGGTYKLTGTMSGFDASGTYEFQARATDRLTSATSTTDTVILKPIFDWGKYDFNFNVPLTIEGDALDDFVIESGTEAMGTNGTWYWRKWKSGRADCYGCRNYGNMAVNIEWGAFFRSEIFMQDLPFGLFVAKPEVIDMSVRDAEVAGWIVNAGRGNGEPSASSTGSFMFARPTSMTISQVHIGFNIIGRWKE